MYFDVEDERGVWVILDKNKQQVIGKDGKPLCLDFSEFELAECEEGDPRFRVIGDNMKWKKGTMLKISDDFELIEDNNSDKPTFKKLF